MKLEIEGLSKTFDTDIERGNKIINDITFSDDVHTMALIGRSGCGKSTLLRMIGGLLTPTSGQILLDGMEVEDSEMYRKKIGFVFQQGGLFRHLSAIENITLPLELVHQMGKEEARERAETLLKRFGLEQDQHKKPRALSGGQQQRIAIARAIAPKPKILLLDEPTSALDPEYTNEVLSMIHELKEDGVGFLLVTHEMGFALHACEKVAFMSSGQILEYGESEAVFKNPKTESMQEFLSRLLEWTF